MLNEKRKSTTRFKKKKIKKIKQKKTICNFAHKSTYLQNE